MLLILNILYIFQATTLADSCCWLENYLPNQLSSSVEAARETTEYLSDAKKDFSHIKFDETEDLLEMLQFADVWNTVASLKASMTIITSFLEDDIGPKQLSKELLGKEEVAQYYSDYTEG